MLQKLVRKNTIVVYNDESIDAWEQNLVSINIKIKQNQKYIDQCTDQLSTINKIYKENVFLREQADSLSHKLDDAHQFMNTLREDPKKQCDDLTKLILNSMEEYEETYPSNQEEDVRWCLYNIKEKVNCILENKNSYLEKYAQLCGLLWNLFNRVDGKDSIFSERIMSILQKTHIAERGHLPNEMRISDQNIDHHFDDIKEKFPHLYGKTNNELHDAEKKDYAAARKALQKTVDKLKPGYLQNKGNEIIRDIEKEKHIKKSQKQKKIPDIKFYTHVLNQTHDVFVDLSKPQHNPKVLSRFIYLANHASGNPFLSKKVTGVMLGIIGSVIFSLSIATMFPSCGLSAIGMVVGTSLLAESLCITAACAGFGLTMNGIGLFYHGMHRGLSKHIHQLANVVDEIECEALREKGDLRYAHT